MNITTKQSEEITRRIKERAALFVFDNFRRPSRSDILVIESAMMMGASIAHEMEMDRLVEEIKNVGNEQARS